MARPASWPPRLLAHKSGRARVYWAGQDYWFGKYGTKEADAAYAEFVKAGQPDRDRKPAPRSSPLTVAGAIERYDAHARQHYRDSEGELTSEIGYVRAAGKILLAVCHAMKADDFRGKALKLAREAMIQRGWARSNVNHHVNVVKRVWKWLASEELVSAEAYGSVRAVEALKAGRTTAPESAKVTPANAADVEAVLPHLTPHLRAAVRLQLYTACRPGEAVALDPDEIERRPGVWLWRPQKHKTAHHGKGRVILIGPKSQEILAPLLTAHKGGVLFQPVLSEAQRRAERRAAATSPRRTPLMLRYVRRTAYTVGEYRQSVTRACVAAGVPHWSPGMLRHTAATMLAAEFGWETARLVLGHSSVNTTRTYVEDHLGRAIDAIGRVG